MLMLWISIAASLAWSAGCVVAARRVLSGRLNGPLPRDRVFLIIAILSLALAPWISLIAYAADDGKSMLGGVVNIIVAIVLFLASLRARKRSAQPVDAALSETSFHQKSAVLMAATLALVYASYFAMTWYDPALAIPLFVGSALLVIVVATASHVALTLFHAPIEDAAAHRDERDREAERYGIRNAYVVLAWGIWIVPAACILKLPLWIIANVAFAFAVCAEIIKYLSQVRFYRTGRS